MAVPFTVPSLCFTEMIPLLLLFLELLDTASSRQDAQLLAISNATAKTFYPAHPPEFSIDGNPTKFYHSYYKTPEPPQWLKLHLEEPAFVSRVVIVNRYRRDIEVRFRSEFVIY